MRKGKKLTVTVKPCCYAPKVRMSWTNDQQGSLEDGLAMLIEAVA